MTDNKTASEPHDLIIRGGMLIDGTGADPSRADVAVDGGRISRIGELGGADARTVIDASGKLVTPGFVDIHTHLDAQVGWDPELTSSSYHGVTTVLMGNCGVSFAPVTSGNRRYLAELMESIEDISADAIMDGLPWTWTSYGEYLDAVERLHPALNVVGLVGHSPIRFEVMGDRSLDEGALPTDEQLSLMAGHVRRSVEEGAVGFSSSRLIGHAVPDGRQTPGTWAELREIEALQAAAVQGGGRGAVFQVVPDAKNRLSTELAMFEQGAALGCQVLFSGGTGPEGDGGVELWGDFLGRQKARGHRIATLAHARPSGALFGIAQLCPLATPAWAELMSRPGIEARVAALRDPATVQGLLTEGREHGFRVPPNMLHPLGLGAQPDYDLDQRASLADLAAEAGTHPVDVFVDRLLASEGRELSNMWVFGGNLEAQWRYLRLEDCIPLLGDAGAHVGQIIDADSTTFFLSTLTRDRGLFSVAEAVHRLSGKPAGILGLRERGEVKEGWHADLNVIDFDRLGTCHPEYVNDFPHGGGRFVVRSRGYDATIVGGRVVVAEGSHTGERPGQVIREFVRG